MGTRTLQVEVPEARLALVLHLLRQAEISQGKAARWLGITRWDILDLMAKYQIESGPETVEELAADIEVARRHSLETQTRANR